MYHDPVIAIVWNPKKVVRTSPGTHVWAFSVSKVTYLTLEKGSLNFTTCRRFFISALSTVFCTTI